MGVRGANDSESEEEELDPEEGVKLNDPTERDGSRTSEANAVSPPSLRRSLRERGGRPSIKEEGAWLADTPILAGDRPQGSTNFEAMLNLLNSLLGNSMLSLPWAFGKVGIWLGVLMLILGSGLNWYTLHLLLKHVDMSGGGSYPLIGRCAFGKVGEMLVISVYLTVSSGAMCAYGVGVADVVSQLVERMLGQDIPRATAGILACILCAPGMFQPSLKQVAKFSAVNFAAATMFCLVLLSLAFMPRVDEGLPLVRSHEENILVAWPIFGYVFASQPSGVMVLSKLEAAQRALQTGRDMDEADLEALQEERRRVSGMAYLIAVTLGALIGGSAYSRFGRYTHGNILTSCYDFQEQLWPGALTILQLGSAVMLLSSAAFVMVPLRFAVLEIMRLSGFRNEYDTTADDTPAILRNRINCTIFCFMVCVSAVCEDISTVYRMIGAVATPLFALILPGAIALKFGMASERRIVGPVLVTLFGMMSLILCISQLFESTN